MCDTYLLGEVRRISPEAPVPVFESIERRQVLGGAANVAANLQALGCQVSLLGVVGEDAAGACVQQLLQAQHLTDAYLLRDAGRMTTEKTRLVANQQQLLRLDQECCAPLPADFVAQALRLALELMPEIDGLVCSDYQKGVCVPALLQPLFTLARERQRPIFVDPKVRDFTLYQGATVLLPNLLEVERAVGGALEGAGALAAAAETLLHQSQAQALLVTRGKDGMTLFQPPQAQVNIPAQAREVFDVTGAGDTVIATFCMAVLCGLSFTAAARLANVAAGIVVGKMGTAVISREELRLALRNDRAPGGSGGVWQRDALAAVLRRRQARGERIVFTNGCFDLLHAGHIQYLQQARALGDCLVVGINNDASVRQLKGAPRPLVPEAERAQVLAALACVDYVTLFSESTPLALIQCLKPDLLVKGGDYSPETVVGREEVEAYGGQTHILSYVPGVSTTEIIHRILELHT